jgi:hypothetical protein
VVPVPDGTPKAGPGTDIVLDGDKFSYKRTVKAPDGSLVITYLGRKAQSWTVTSSR